MIERERIRVAEEKIKRDLERKRIKIPTDIDAAMQKQLQIYKDVIEFFSEEHRNQVIDIIFNRFIMDSSEILAKRDKTLRSKFITSLPIIYKELKAVLKKRLNKAREVEKIERLQEQISEIDCLIEKHNEKILEKLFTSVCNKIDAYKKSNPEDVDIVAYCIWEWKLKSKKS
jgi:hypothetical protein